MLFILIVVKTVSLVVCQVFMLLLVWTGRCCLDYHTDGIAWLLQFVIEKKCSRGSGCFSCVHTDGLPQGK